MDLNLSIPQGPVEAHLSPEGVLSPDCFDEMVVSLRSGGVVLAPTDTVYGLFGDARSDATVQRIVKIKGRPDGRPIPVAVPDAEMVAEVARLEGVRCARELMQAFWPGALTIILPAIAGLPSQIAPAGSVGVRAPGHPFLLRLLRSAGHPLTSTSANLSGDAQPVSIAAIDASLIEKVDFVIDEGEARAPVPSTVIDLTQDVPQIVRHGAVSQEDIERILGKNIR